MHLLRTRFAKDIVCEFLPPRKKTKSDKVIIFCDGMPSVPGKNSLAEFYSQKGYWFFNPRYRGSWESDGQFLKRSPHLDIKDVIDGLVKNFTDLRSKKPIHCNPSKIIIIGSSFGGAAATILSANPNVDKVIGLSPAVDWKFIFKTNSPEDRLSFIQNAFGQGYRINATNWRKLQSGNFYNPSRLTSKLVGTKMLLIHAQDDPSVPYQSVKKFAEKTGSRLISLKTGGHLSSKILMTPRINKLVSNFIKQK